MTEAADRGRRLRHRRRSAPTSPTSTGRSGRIEDAGASHASSLFFAAALISGGRVLPEHGAPARGRLRAGAACATPSHGVLCRQPDGRGRTSTSTRRCARANAGAGGGRRRHRAGPPSRDRPGPAGGTSWTGCTRWSGRGCASWATSPPGWACGSRSRRCSSRASREYTADPARLAAELRAVDHPHVVGTLDVSHSYIMTTFRGTRSRRRSQAFAPVTGHFHLHDSFGRPTYRGRVLHRFRSGWRSASATCICRSAGATSRSRSAAGAARAARHGANGRAAAPLRAPARGLRRLRPLRWRTA